ncbi:hypothetical protein C8F04DRAFT_1177128 [Mycena alexandri]|uniref:Uncharacterized protein n=1 Tax=Mycena alexandri TaxID=1745969 RepID=A0AAD6TBD5_9AGAR|nr:hypothetical protein C8F04DRAFT_1177128 [Mycena alexandri]
MSDSSTGPGLARWDASTRLLKPFQSTPLLCPNRSKYFLPSPTVLLGAPLNVPPRLRLSNVRLALGTRLVTSLPTKSNKCGERVAVGRLVLLTRNSRQLASGVLVPTAAIGQITLSLAPNPIQSNPHTRLATPLCAREPECAPSQVKRANSPTQLASEQTNPRPRIQRDSAPDMLARSVTGRMGGAAGEDDGMDMDGRAQPTARELDDFRGMSVLLQCPHSATPSRPPPGPAHDGRAVAHPEDSDSLCLIARAATARCPFFRLARHPHRPRSRSLLPMRTRLGWLTFRSDVIGRLAGAGAGVRSSPSIRPVRRPVRSVGYKGKALRSCLQLPPEVVRIWRVMAPTHPPIWV